MTDYFTHRLDASDTDAAEARLRDLYGDVHLGGLGGYREDVVGDARFAVADVELDGRFDVTAEVDTVTLAFSTPGYRWRVGRDEGDLSAEPVVFQPREPMTSRITGRCRVTTVNLAVPALTDFAAALYARPVAIAFAGQRSRTPGQGRHFMQLARVTKGMPLLDSALVRATVYRSLATAALEGFQLQGDHEQRTRTAEAALHAYRRASAFIDDHLSLPVTATDIARAAGIAEAELERAFRAHSPSGRSAQQQLQHARLAAAHRDLVKGDPTLGDTVAATAARWGFPRPRRFAALHRRTYGIDPRQTLDG